MKIRLYDIIGKHGNKGISAKDFIKRIEDEGDINNIELHISSPGGNIFDAISIYNYLKQHPAKIYVYIDGICASAATIVSLAGDKIVMAKNGIYMIHRPWAMVIGNVDAALDLAAQLEKIGDSIIEMYIDKTKKTKEEIVELIIGKNKNGTFFNSQEAESLGFVDSLSEELKVAAMLDIEEYKNIFGYLENEKVDDFVKSASQLEEKEETEETEQEQESKTDITEGVILDNEKAIIDKIEDMIARIENRK